MKTDNEKTEYRASKTQTLFDDVDRVVQHLQIRIGTIPDHQEDRLLIIESQLTLAKAVQTLRPSYPTTKEQPKTPRIDMLGGTAQEWELIQYMRTQGLSANKLTTYLETWEENLYHPDIDDCLRDNPTTKEK